jgi:hypothetical protein
MVESNRLQTATEKLRPFAERDFAAFRGLGMPTTLSDCTAFFAFDTRAKTSGFLGGRRRQLATLTGIRKGFNQGIRIWVVNEEVQLFDAVGVQLPEEPKALLAKLGEPDHKLDSYLGLLRLEKSEYVYLRRGLTLFLNPDTSAVLRIAAFAPSSLEEYQASLRLDLEMKRLPARLEGAAP